MTSPYLCDSVNDRLECLKQSQVNFRTGGAEHAFAVENKIRRSSFTINGAPKVSNPAFLSAKSSKLLIATGATFRIEVYIVVVSSRESVSIVFASNERKSSSRYAAPLHPGIIYHFLHCLQDRRWYRAD
jgi:hypothetical protein